eukprot:TRINITY_DN20572_c0_g1_i1.p1 TRINITY_DN20572_c0_g1~~TRINITY_DN20572_c0_g1_i1.p1  ORF type:complete len:201 (+),score=31.05 TRINITY_DN20572_c0_g1_i1:82-684(+)
MLINRLSMIRRVASLPEYLPSEVEDAITAAVAAAMAARATEWAARTQEHAPAGVTDEDPHGTSGPAAGSQVVILRFLLRELILGMELVARVEAPARQPSEAQVEQFLMLAASIEVEANHMCAICLCCKYEDPPPAVVTGVPEGEGRNLQWVRLPCAHVFHRECFRNLVARPGPCLCPLCRFDLLAASQGRTAAGAEGSSQ